MRGVGCAALLALLAPVGATLVAADAHRRYVHVGEHITSSCTPYSWKDYVLDVTSDLTEYNLLFEVEDIGPGLNPTGLSVALWEDEVPPNRHAEHRTDLATGKLWAVVTPRVGRRKPARSFGRRRRRRSRSPRVCVRLAPSRVCRA